MKTSSLVFEPITYQNNTIMTVSLITIVLMSLFFVYNNKKKVAYFEKKRKRLWSMLAFFGILLGICTLIFGGMVSSKYNTVKFHATDFELPNGHKLKYKSVKSSYLFFEQQAKRMNSNELVDSTRMLVIESYSGENYFIPEKFYNVVDMLHVLREKTK